MNPLLPLCLLLATSLSSAMLLAQSSGSILSQALHHFDFAAGRTVDRAGTLELVSPNRQLAQDRFGTTRSAVDLLRGSMRSGGTASAMPSGSQTIAFWMKLPQVSTGNSTRYLWDLREQSNDGQSVAIINQAAREIRFGVAPGLNFYSYAFTSADWVHLTFVIDESANKYRLYFDGVLQTPTSAVAPAPRTRIDSRRFTIGNSWSNGGSQGSKCTFDDFVLYDRALTATEITALFQSPSDGKLASFSFDASLQDSVIEEVELTMIDTRGSINVPQYTFDRFNNVEGAVELLASGLRATSPLPFGFDGTFSAATWVYVPSAPNLGNDLYLFDSRPAGTSSAQSAIALVDLTDNRLRFGMPQNLHSYRYIFPRDQWVHLAFSFDPQAREIKVFADGSELTLLSAAPWVSTTARVTSQLMIGQERNPNASTNFPAVMDAFELYERPLTTSEVQALSDDRPAPDTQAPTAPTNLAFNNLTATRVDMSWTASSDNQRVAGYELQLDTLTTFQQPGMRIGDVTQVPLANLLPNKRFYVRVRAYDVSGNLSAWATSNFLTPATPDTQAPSAPRNLQVNDLTPTAARFTWEAATDDTGVDRYEVTVTLRPGASVGPLSAGQALSYSYDDLMPDTAYQVAVVAYDAAGNAGPTAIAQFRTPVVPDTEPPTIPGVRTTEVTATEISIEWAASQDNVGIKHYLVSINGTVLGDTRRLDYNFASLQPNTRYTIVVVAVDLSDNVSDEARIDITTQLASSTTVALPGRIQLSPNPVVDGVVSVATTGELQLPTGAQLVLTDATGKRVLRATPLHSKVDLNGLPAGLYSVQVTDAHGALWAQSRLLKH